MSPLELDALEQRYLAAQLSGRRREALRLLVEEGLNAGASVAQLCHDVIAAAQAEIGRLWQQNRISVADEHIATAISQVALAHLYQHAPSQKRIGKTVVIACVEGELHDFPARLVADTLDLAGYDVVYLGASVPTTHLCRLLAERPPDLLALSVTMSFNVPSARNAVAAVRERMPNLKIAVGGGACKFAPGLCSELNADANADDAQQLVLAAHRLLGVEP